MASPKSPLTQQPPIMKTKFLAALVTTLAICLGAISASAQSAQPVPPPLPTVVNLDMLAPELQVLIATHRNAAKALLEQRNASLQALRTATPAQRDAIIANLRDIMKTHTMEQKELAKAIRDAIKARRDHARRG